MSDRFLAVGAQVATTTILLAGTRHEGSLSDSADVCRFGKGSYLSGQVFATGSRNLVVKDVQPAEVEGQLHRSFGSSPTRATHWGRCSCWRYPMPDRCFGTQPVRR